MDTEVMTYSPKEQEVKSLVSRLVESEYLSLATKYLYPELTEKQLREMLAGVSTVREFQYTIMFRFCHWIVDNTITGITHEGTERMHTLPPSVFISNHRDIVLDAIFLQYLRICANLETTYEVVGANLFEMPLMRMLATLNKMVPLRRGGTKRELYNAFSSLSQWIRQRVGEGDNVWIAQRNGRTKDGRDATEEALVKMLAMSGDRKSPVTALDALNLVPMSISYEWEPCGIAKAREVAIRQHEGTYVKAPGEDTNSIVQGLLANKGRVHLTLGKPLSRADLEATGGDTREIARLIDRRIAAGYRLWPNNYIAADLLHGTAYGDKYSPAERDAFTDYLDKACADNPVPGFRDILLGIYANPVNNLKQ